MNALIAAILSGQRVRLTPVELARVMDTIGRHADWEWLQEQIAAGLITVTP